MNSDFLPISANRTGSFNALCSIMRKYKPLTPEEENELIDEYRSHGESSDAAREKLILHNIRFICNKAKQKSFDAERIIDLVNVGIIGFDEALKKFDPSLGFKLITYAVYYIDLRMNMYITDSQLVKRSNYMKFGYRMPRIESRFFAENGREPSAEEMAELIEKESGESVKDLRDVEKICISSTDENVFDDESVSISDCSEFAIATASINEYEREIDGDDIKFRVHRMLELVSPKARHIVMKYYGIDEDREYSVDEIAEECHMTPTRIRQIIRSSEKTMQKNKKYLFAE